MKGIRQRLVTRFNVPDAANSAFVILFHSCFLFFFFSCASDFGLDVVFSFNRKVHGQISSTSRYYESAKLTQCGHFAVVVMEFRRPDFGFRLFYGALQLHNA